MKSKHSSHLYKFNVSFYSHKKTKPNIMCTGMNIIIKQKPGEGEVEKIPTIYFDNRNEFKIATDRVCSSYSSTNYNSILDLSNGFVYSFYCVYTVQHRNHLLEIHFFSFDIAPVSLSLDVFARWCVFKIK